MLDKVAFGLLVYFIILLAMDTFPLPIDFSEEESIG